MKKLVKVIGIIALVAVSGFVFISCKNGSDSRPSELVGIWEIKNSHYNNGFGFSWNHIPDKMELFKDGTGIVDDSLNTPWKVENNRLILNVGGNLSLAYNYKISGSELTLTYDDETVGYNKVKK